jgi:hypothetical protein
MSTRFQIIAKGNAKGYGIRMLNHISDVAGLLDVRLSRREVTNYSPGYDERGPYHGKYSRRMK